ncbi:polysaccharide biosynthesis protein [Metabacillus arenae]|uniref:Polysaccharide biosynthesis protein n=1 Tax=Metabacillus arenae TaxID=2771434 RepID=A0A926RX86_9BACI|nr:polysaccharide biosynthesis protein [Metabacillus arenae]MBD1380405.1 polysaccharide biosynthesis protein [Metabacillus arenae]
MNSFYRSTLLLTIAAFISECIEFIINIILARELGEHGMGLYMSILPIIFFVVVIASIEMPISISKYIAEKDEKYHHSMLQHATSFTIKLTFVFILLGFLVVPFIPVFSDYHPFVRWLVLLLIPIISFSSIARGYFMGVQGMGKIATSNFLRKAVQLLVLFSLYQWIHFDMETSLLVAISTLIASEFIVCTYLFSHYLLQIRAIRSKHAVSLSAKEVRKSLLSVSLPTTGLRIFNSLTNAVQPFLVKAALISAGVSSVAAVEHYGMLAGVALTIGFFPAFIAHSLMVALIPNVSEAFAKKDFVQLQKLLQQAMWITFIYGIPAVYLIFHFAHPLTEMFFQSSSAAFYLQMLWPYFLFHFFVIPMQAYLIGLGLVKDAFYHTVWSHIISFAMMYFLGSMEHFQMTGIILGMNTGIVLLTLMHYFTICKRIGLSVFLFKNQDQSINKI